MVSGLFLVLAALSGVAAAVGFVWTVVAGGRRKSDQGPAEGDVEARPATSARDSGHTDKREGTTAGGGFSFADARRLLRTGHGRQALPALLFGGGLLGLLLFGALVLLTSLPSIWLGLAALAIALYVAVSELRGILTGRGGD